jgi:hypothetical protein
MARRLAFVLSLAVCILSAAPSALAQPPSVVPPKEVRAGDLVVLGRDAAVEGALSGSLVVVAGNVRISGRVGKDVIAFGGDVVLEPGAVVLGDLLAVGGTVTVPPGEPLTVAGRILTLGELEAAFAAELQTSPLAAKPVSGLLLAFRLVLLFVWLVVGLLLLRLVPRAVSGAAGLVRGRLTTVAALGVAAVLSGLLVSAFLLLVLPATAGLLLTGLLLVFLAAAKTFGLAVVFVALGRRLTRGARRGSPLFGDPAALALGLALLGVLSLVPVAGPLVWSVASLLGIGVALLAVSRKEALLPAF